jgi:septal ring factor EnvC (AmiA/AmiB activator)
MTNHLRGAVICGNALMASTAAADEAVLDVIAQDVFHPEVITRAIEKAIAALQPDQRDLDGTRAELTASLRRLEEELARLTEAIVTGGGSLPTLTAAVRDREGRKLLISHELAALDRMGDVTRLDVPRMKRDPLDRVSSWGGLAMRHVSEARQVLRMLLEAA